MTKINYTNCLVTVFLFANLQSYSQGWVGNGGNNLNAVNSSLSATPISIGVGTNLPSAQLHTTGTLRHQNLTNSNLLNRVLVTDTSGNVFWREASTLGTSNAWLTTGNNNINDALNFLGTTNNQAVSFRVNNQRRFSISRESTPAGFTRNASQVEVGVPTDATNLTNLFVWSRDVVGLSIPYFISSDVSGMTFSSTAGNNNTLGRLMRLNQGNTNANGGSNFYDIGISNTQALFITPRQVPGSIGFPMKMFTISTADRVGIRLAWGAEPTADFHTVGSVRHENLPSGSGTQLVIDAQGNIFRSNGIIARVNSDVQTEIDNLKKEIESLKKMIYSQNKSFNISDIPLLYQNAPNPYDQGTQLKFYLPKTIKSASLIISDMSGKQLHLLNIGTRGDGNINFESKNLPAGMYLYSLVTETGVVDTKQMAIMK